MREVDIWNIHHSSGSRLCELLSAAAAAALQYSTAIVVLFFDMGGDRRFCSCI